MDTIYNSYEVFEIADKIEVAGAKFYRAAAEIADNGSSVKDLLLELAAMEDSHQSYFKSLRSKYGIEEIDGLIDLEGQAAGYLKAIGQAHAIHNLTTILDDGNMSEEDILKVAIDFEKDTVVYFAALKSALINEDEKAEIDVIVKEESEHVGILMKKLNEVQRQD